MSSQVLIDAGLIAGGDMTPEAALSKLSYVLAKKDLSLDAKKKVCFSSLASLHECVCEWILPVSLFLCVALCAADGSEPPRRDELGLCRHQSLSERQPIHPGHRQISEHQLQRGEPPFFLIFLLHRNRAAFFQNPEFDLDVLSLNIWGCPQELAAIRDALTPPLACAAAKIGDIEALDALKEMVNPLIMAPLHIWNHRGKTN